MGWCSDDRDHVEGYLVAFVPLEGCGPSLLRELQYPTDDKDRDDVVAVAAACECGWRSPRFHPSTWRTKATWRPFCVLVDERDEDRARALFQEHLEHMAANRSARASRGTVAVVVRHG